MKAVTAEDPGEIHARIPTTGYQQIDFLISKLCVLGAHVSIPNKRRMYNRHMTHYRRTRGPKRTRGLKSAEGAWGTGACGRRLRGWGL